MKTLLTCFLPLIFSSLSTLADPGVRTGTMTYWDEENKRPLVVFFAKSSHYDPSDPPLMVFHGMRRNAWDYRDAWIDLAAKHKLFVVVPYFREVDFPGTVGYNLGNVFPSETDLTRQPEMVWSYHIPEKVLEHLIQSGETSAKGYTAFGHSAGSQFLHRKILFTPDDRLLLAIAANAGWYTFPDPSVIWPYGCLGTGIDPSAFPPYLASRLVILLGDQDNDPQHRSLRRAPEANAQGPHRLARGHNFFRFAKNLAEELETPFAWEIEEVPGVDHDNARMAPAAVRLVVDFLESYKRP